MTGGPAPSRTRILRRGYAVAGVAMAVVWLGAGHEPAWVHALRTAVILLTVPSLLQRANRRLRTSPHRRLAVTRLIAVRTLVISGALTASYLLGRLLAPHAADDGHRLGVLLLLVALTIPWQIRAAHRARVGGALPSTGFVVSTPRLVVAKFTLLGSALLLQLLLGAPPVTAAAIVIATASLGPAIHPWLLVGTAPTGEPLRITGP